MQNNPNSSGFSAEDFVHLHLHTDYSLLQSTIQLKPLTGKLCELGMKSCAMTDYGNMFGAISFYSAMKAAGLHPVIGYEAFVTFGNLTDKGGPLAAGERPYYPVVLLALDLTGFYNLTYLASKAYTDGFYHKPRIDLELLAGRSTGLIGLSGGGDGPLRHYLRRGETGRARETAGIFSEIFGKDNFFIEIQDPGLSRESTPTAELVGLARSCGLPLVATNDVHYLTPDDAKAHEVLMCIGDGKTIFDSTRTIYDTPNHYLRSAAEMWKIFGRELPEALTNTVRIADRCRVELPLENNLALPDFPIPAGSRCRTTAEYFREVVLEGFAQRRQQVWDPLLEKGRLKYTPEDYLARIETEIGTITAMNFPGYFLIVWDFIKYAARRGIPVGPGRGSAAGSLVAYCLKITDVDPLQYDLLFERFLNPERISMPDIDIDFCVRGRAEVIDHVSELYGRDSVCQIITFGTMASRAAIKDVGRVLNMPYGDVEKIAKLIPPPVRGRNVSIGQAIEQVADLRKLIGTDPQVTELVDLARRLEGCARHTSVHAAGVVISPKPLCELVPVAVSGKNELTSQYPMGDLEKVGMLKMDFLALTTLTIISDCLKSIKQDWDIEIDWSEIPLDDQRALELFAEGRTEAIFQFESDGMRQICQRLKPKELEDLAALNALYRPGPLDGGMVDDFIARHRGEKRVKYIVPEMRDILSNTYGILVYQEQIMQLAQKLAGYTLGEADMMRRAMGKKKRSEMAVHEEKFISGAVARGIDRTKATEIFYLMAQFADYGFNRSHSVAYAYLAYQTAYLKAHYPANFYASVLSSESQDSAKIYKYSNELRAAGLKLLPPDINESGIGFTPRENSVRFGLSAIKGIGQGSVEAIICARDTDGKFASLLDFTARVESGAVNRRGLESLIAAGAFDSVKPEGFARNLWRAKLFAAIDRAISHGQRVSTDRRRGQSGLFGDFQQTPDEAENDLPDVPAWTAKEFSDFEKNAVGFYLSQHPLDEFSPVLNDLKILKIADYEELRSGDRITLAGIISGFQARFSKKGNRFGLFRLEDQSSGVKCLIWAEPFARFAGKLKDDGLILAAGRVETNDGSEITLFVDDVLDLADLLPRKARSLSVEFSGDGPDETYLEDVFRLLSAEPGKCEVRLEIIPAGDPGLRVVVRTSLRIQGSGRLDRDLRAKGCRVGWFVN